MDPEEVVHSEDEVVHSEDEVVHSEDETPISIRVERRGATVMHCLSGDWDGIIIRVHFDGKGRPIGQKVCNKLSGWEGALARSLIPLSAFQKWTKAPPELLKLLWAGILIRFDIDIRYRKSVLKSFGVRWRTFKNMLTVKYIMPFKDDPEALSKPPAKYKLIKKADWDAFVKSRLTEEFQEKSKLQSARRAKGKYNHRVSRLGYAGLIDKMQEELGESFDEDDRAGLWLLARQNKSGEYFNDDIRKVAEKIEQLKKEEAEGKLVTQGSDDVLTKALGTPEHCGRVRAGGKYVTPTTYFNLPKRGSKAHRAEMESTIRKKEEENQALKERVRELETLQGVISSQHIEKVASNGSKNNSKKRMESPNDDVLSSGTNNKTINKCLERALGVNSRKKSRKAISGAKSKSDEAVSKQKLGNEQDVGLKNSSVAKLNSKVAVFQHKSGSKQCKLALGSKSNIVADASLIEGFGPDDNIHNVKMGEGYVRVQIIRAILANSLLPRPIPDDDITTVGGAVGYHVAWPSDFVVFDNLAISKPMLGNKQAVGSKDNDNGAKARSKGNDNGANKAKSVMPISKPKSGNEKCKLALGSKSNVVADACIIEGFGPDDKIHKDRMGEGYVSVQIIRAISAIALLPRPIPDDDITRVGGAVGYHVAWPRDFVILDNKKNEAGCDEHDEIIFEEFAVLVGNIMKGNHISEMDMRIFERELQFYIAKDEIMDICHKQMLNANCIVVYIRYLYEKYESSRQRFGFCYPGDFNLYADKKEMNRLVSNRLMARQGDQIIFLPYNSGIHWVLVIIDVSAKKVYFLDSTGGVPDIKLRCMVNIGMKTLALSEGKRVEPEWDYVKCPIQPGGYECGYYVLRFMRHFMMDPSQSIKTKLMELANTITYTNAELIEIRMEFIDFIERFISPSQRFDNVRSIDG